MVAFELIDRIVDFLDDNTTEIRVVLKTNEENLLKRAKEIDGEYFSEKCFGIAFIYDHNENKMYLLGEGLYYVDKDGDNNYINIDKNVIIKLQGKTEEEYKKYLENPKEYCEKNKFLFKEEL